MALAEVLPPVAIGIDLGTTFSCVAVFTDERVQVIKNQDERSTIPSYVSFTENARLVGQRAKDRALIDPENTINNMKRLIGRKISDDRVKEYVDSYPFKVIDDGQGNPKIQVRYEGKDQAFRPEEISSAVLGELKTLAEIFLKRTVRNAVITVPAYFTNAQRQATIDAGTIAGLNVLATINEPTAAALAYGFDNQANDQSSKVLVYDFGGGTFDVSVLNVTNGHVETLATGGDGNLGGEDIDDLLVKHFNSEFMTLHDIDLFARARSSNGTEARNAKKALRRLRFASEKAKIKLSSERSTKVDLDLLFDGKDLYTKITRRFFETLCQDIVRRTLVSVKQIIEMANITPEDITELILVGGSTRIPLVNDMLSEYFPRTDVCGNINPDEAVAYGAAIKAALKCGVHAEVIQNFRLRDVTPMSLGIESFGGIMATVIKRNSPVPVQKKKIYSTNRDNQSQICIRVYEGERHVTKHNNFLGEFTLVGIPPAPKGVPKVEVIFHVDANGILRVKATDLGTEWENTIVLTNNNGRLSPREIEKAVREAERMRLQDLKYRKTVEARERLESYASQIEKSLRNPRLRESVHSEQLEKITEKIDEALNLYKSPKEPEESDFAEKYNELDKLWLPSMMHCYDREETNQDAPVLQSGDSFYQKGDFEIVDLP